MFSRKTVRIFRTVAFRLTLWYAAIFTVFSFSAFLIFYFTVASLTQTRTDEELSNKVKEFSSVLAMKGVEELKTEMELESKSKGRGDTFFRLVNLKGEEIVSSNKALSKKLGVRGSALKHVIGGTAHVFETAFLPDHVHGIRVVYAMATPGQVLQIGKSLEKDTRFMESFREIFGTTLAILIGFSGLVGWFMARRALSSMEAVTQTAVEISKGVFDRRVDVKGTGDEIDRLAGAFNRMLDRIEELVTRMKEVTDDIAHDLRSSITRIRGMAELKVTSAESNTDCEELAGDTIEECDRLLQMINTMLEISEAEAGVASFKKEGIDLSGIIQEACDLFRPVADDKGVDLVLENLSPCGLYADKPSLRRVIVNLLENAIKFTPANGRVTLSVHEEGEQIQFSVKDTGAGISQEDLPHIFERLFRCEASRSEAGFGLGLSLARAVARAHGGDIHVASTLGKGSTFTVTLPRDPTPVDAGASFPRIWE